MEYIVTVTANTDIEVNFRGSTYTVEVEAKNNLDIEADSKEEARIQVLKKAPHDVFEEFYVVDVRPYTNLIHQALNNLDFTEIFEEFIIKSIERV